MQNKLYNRIVMQEGTLGASTQKMAGDFFESVMSEKREDQTIRVLKMNGIVLIAFHEDDYLADELKKTLGKMLFK